MRINILICLAGHGKRFVDKGYSIPKPFLPLLQGTMLDAVIDNVRGFDEHFNPEIILAHLSDHAEYVSKYKYKKVTVDRVTRGAAETALLAKNLINNETPLVITDADHLVGGYDHIYEGISYFQSRYCDFGTWNFITDDPKWSYVKVSGGKTTEVAEKIVVSNLANTGSFYFREGQLFVEAAERMIQKNDTFRGEFYLSQTLPYLIADGLKGLPYMVNYMIPLGTPKDYEDYLNNK